MTRAQLSASLASWRRRETYRRRKWKAAGPHTAARRKWLARLREAKSMVARREKQLAASRPLRLRAYDEAVGLIGVMEVGGNNRGAKVLEIIRANGGAGPEPWCGDFQAFVYRKAGSKSVQRAWAAVRFIGHLTGQSIVSKPLKGDMVCFTFDHVGMFVKDNGNGTITTIEGNTGASGAQSDSSTGGDGVYKKTRSKSLVSRYVRVHR